MSCTKESKPHIVFGIDACSSCKMVIDQPKEAAAIFVNNEFLPFCNPICMVSEINRRKYNHIKPDRVLVSDYTSGSLIDAEKATFYVGEVQTVMNFGVVAFTNEEDAVALVRKNSDEILDYIQFRTRFENADKVYRVNIDANGLQPGKILAVKGEIVSIKVNYELNKPDQLIILGYTNIKPLDLTPGSTTTVMKLVTDKPGAGFPITLKKSGKVIGQLVVQGTHTKEETL